MVMADNEERVALNGLEKNIFQLMSKGATKAQWAIWLRAPLGHALAKGDKSLTLALLAAGADASAGWEGCNGRTLLGAAAEGGSPEVVSAVLEAGGLDGIDTVSGDEGMTPIHHAIAGGHTDAARVLMVAGACMRMLDDRGRSALHYAVEGGHLQLAENVMIGGANPTAKDTDGDTPLHLAAGHDDQAFVNTLLRRGASVSATNLNGQHPLHVAVEHDLVAVAEALLKAGADPNVVYDDIRSPLSLASRSLAMTRTLLKHGADVKAVDDIGFTALHWAGESGNSDVIAALVEAGADVAAESDEVLYARWGDFSDLTPLHAAAMYCSLGGISALLRGGADVDVTESNGQTPLHVVCKISASDESAKDSKKTADAADLLLRWGADETLTGNDGRTPEQLIERVSSTKPLQKVLASAPADRAWRRRGMMIMCRAFLNTISTKDGEGRASKANARRGRGRGGGGGSAGGASGRGSVLIRCVDLEDDTIFRNIIGFL